jgi:hypothetical protein
VARIPEASCDLFRKKPDDDRIPDVQKYYGDYHALRGINGISRAGEFFSLLGPSGCGKTTLLRTIAGFEDISSGVVMIDGKDMEGVPANVRPTNMVFQSYAIFPHMTVERERGLRPAQGPAFEGGKGQGGGRGAGDGGPEGLWQAARRMRCRVASGSGWPWPAR